MHLLHLLRSTSIESTRPIVFSKRSDKRVALVMPVDILAIARGGRYSMKLIRS